MSGDGVGAVKGPAHDTAANCQTCRHEFTDAALSGNPAARLCRPCWDGDAPEVVAWVTQAGANGKPANIINGIGMADRKATGCPGWEGAAVSN